MCCRVGENEASPILLVLADCFWATCHSEGKRNCGCVSLLRQQQQTVSINIPGFHYSSRSVWISLFPLFSCCYCCAHSLHSWGIIALRLQSGGSLFCSDGSSLLKHVIFLTRELEWVPAFLSNLTASPADPRIRSQGGTCIEMILLSIQREPFGPSWRYKEYPHMPQ